MRGPLILFLATSTVLCTGCGKAKVWTPFTTPDGKASIVFPCGPKQMNISKGGVNMLGYVAELRKESYLFTWADLPAGAPADNQAALESMVGKGGKILEQSPISVNSHAGTAYELEVKTPITGFATGRMFHVKDRLYQVMALGPDCRASNPDVVRFLGSLDLSKAN